MTNEVLKLNNQKSSFLQNLWIIEKGSGICIFEKNFEKHKKIKFSNNLICGFFSAISMLALEVFAERISHIKFSNCKLTFKHTNNFLFIFRIQNQPSPSTYKINDLINEISKMFVDLYDNSFQNWNRDIRQFKSFSHDLENKLY